MNNKQRVMSARYSFCGSIHSFKRCCSVERRLKSGTVGGSNETDAWRTVRGVVHALEGLGTLHNGGCGE